MEFHTPTPGQDFASLRGDGGLGNYTFHKRFEQTPAAIIKQGGANAEQLLDEWAYYEYKNRRACAEYDRMMHQADNQEKWWDEKWKKERIAS